MELKKLRAKALAATHVPEGCTLVMFDGAVRSSKTISSLLMWARFLRQGPAGMQALIGRTESSAITNVVIPLQEMFGTHRVVLNRGLGIVTVLGRVVNIYGANDAAAYTKIQGATLAGAYVDEGAVIAESFFNMLRSRLSVAGAMLYLTCNPEGPKHWLKVNWLDKAEWHLDRDGRLHHFEKYDHEGEPEHLPIWRVTFLLDDNLALIAENPEFVKHLRTSWPPGSVFYRRYIRSEWVNAEGAIYGMWDERAMTVSLDELPSVERTLMIGVDYGSTHATRAYLAALLWAVTDEHGRPDWARTRELGVRRARSFPGRHLIVILDEFAPEEATVGEHARQFEVWAARNAAAYGAPEWIAVDPAAKAFRLELFERGRADVMNAHNAVVPGIQTVQSLMYSGAFYVVRERCPQLIDHIPGYVWDTKATEAGRTAPRKEDDDEVDALRYALYTSRRYWRSLIPLAPIAEVDTEEETAT